MEEWKRVCLILCFFGVLIQFRPSEPFVTKYLNNPPVNFTLEEITSQIYPVATYSTMALLVFVFLVTDLFCYKPLVVLEGVSGFVVYLMLIICRDLFLIQILEVFYGLFMACEVAYFTYIYAKVDKKHYQEVSGYTKFASLLGKALSGVVSQILISSGYFSYYSLNFFTLGGVTLATLWAFALPSVKSSLYFHRVPQGIEEDGEVHVEESFKTTLKRGIKLLLKDLQMAFTNHNTLKWALWSSLATCGYYQVLNYVQVLWEQVLKDSNEPPATSNLNGAIEATYTFLSAFTALGCGKLKLDWIKFGSSLLCFFSILLGLTLLAMSSTLSIWVAYGTYIIFKMTYHGLITIANSEVAKGIQSDSYGLIFGIMSFSSLLLQTGVTAVVNSWLSIPIRDQFPLYATYFLLLGLLFGVDFLLNLYSTVRSRFEVVAT